MAYLPDANAVITPFKDGPLGSLMVGLLVKHEIRNGTTLEAQRWLQEWFRQGFEKGNLVATADVVSEVTKKDDVPGRLLKDLSSRGSLIVLRPTPRTLSHLATIESVIRARFEPQHADDFSNSADPMLLALAATYGATVVTLERHVVPEYDPRAGKVKGKVRIPYLAWILGIPCVPLYQALEAVS